VRKTNSGEKSSRKEANKKEKKDVEIALSLEYVKTRRT
jgi:hypothetical protein